jgi:phosphohistidine phosphatase
MKVFLVRHAIAEPRGPVWPDDDVRPVTVRGAARLRAVAERLADRGVQVEQVWTSPVLRARQTAEVLAPLWTTDGTVVVVDALAPTWGTARAGAALAARPAIAAVAVVGHEPALGNLAAWMVGASSPLPFKKGGVARIDFPGHIAAGAGTLLWLVTPKLVLEQ